jgi:hypothetical protein
MGVVRLGFAIGGLVCAAWLADTYGTMLGVLCAYWVGTLHQAARSIAHDKAP